MYIFKITKIHFAFIGNFSDMEFSKRQDKYKNNRKVAIIKKINYWLI